MDYFYGGGGNNRPYFIYRFKVKECTSEMYSWADTYPEKGHFCRWHVEWGSVYSTEKNVRDYDVVQFEHSDPAKIFRIAFAGEYEEITMKEYR